MKVIGLVDLDPAPGTEADKRRRVVIVSNDGANSAAEPPRRATGRTTSPTPEH